jgi:hypothetical protein
LLWISQKGGDEETEGYEKWVIDPVITLQVFDDFLQNQVVTCARKQVLQI